MEKKACTVDGCEKQSRSRGLCGMHHMRLLRRGSVGAAEPEREAAPDACTVEGCGREDVQARGLCKMHYTRLHQYGTTEARPGARTKHVTCTIEGCDKPHHAKGYCTMHYARVSTGVPMDAPPLKNPRVGTCLGPECTDPVSVQGMCGAHYYQRRQGQELRPKRSYAPQGAGSITQAGYRVFKVNGKTRGEHRLNAEAVLGRPLAPNEDVHHVNTDRLDNHTDGPFRLDERGRLRSGNLEIWGHSHPRGGEIGPLLEWFVSELELYQDVLPDDLVARLGALSERSTLTAV